MLLPVCLAACGTGNGALLAGTQPYADARVRVNLGEQDVLHVDLLDRRAVAADRPVGRKRLVAALPDGTCGHPRIAATRETRIGSMEPLRLRLYLVAVACPGGASRHLGG